MKIFMVVLFSGLTSMAATIGESSFTVWTETGVATIDIRETDDGKILGRSGFDQWGIINLKYKNGTLKGQSDGGFTNISCSATRCEGQVGSGSVNIKLKENGTVLEGSLNHVFIRAKTFGDRIEIQADGSLDLTMTSPAHYSGSAYLGSNYISQASLKSSGTLVGRLQRDPAYFIVYLISPLVRNGL